MLAPLTVRPKAEQEGTGGGMGMEETPSGIEDLKMFRTHFGLLSLDFR